MRNQRRKNARHRGLRLVYVGIRSETTQKTEFMVNLHNILSIFLVTRDRRIKLTIILFKYTKYSRYSQKY
jgi:hypothetical protein